MPITLPSGLTLCLIGDGPFDAGPNWFKCPPDHFWIKVAGPEMGEPLFDPNDVILQSFEHVPIPRNHAEVAKYSRVCEMLGDGVGVWRGEWLHEFPRYRDLSAEDLAAWDSWMNSPTVERFLDEMLALCAQYAERCRNAVGYCAVSDRLGQ